MCPWVICVCALQVEMSPLENASEVIENKTLQLRTLIAQCQMRQMQNINPLTMCLNGVIDAAVNGGLARYQEVHIHLVHSTQFKTQTATKCFSFSISCVAAHGLTPCCIAPLPKGGL